MPGERRSLQERIRERQQSGLVGRQGQLIQYRENFGFPVDDERRRFFFNIHGDAGVGKTFLTRQLRQIAAGTGALTAYIDETVEDVTSAMTAIAEEFNRGGDRLREFEKRAAEYRQRRHELESDPQAPAGVAAFLTKTAVTISLAAARDIPVAGSLLAPVDVAATAAEANRAREYLTRKFRDHRDVRLMLSPADELTPVFVDGLNRAAASRTVALFFDTYERTGPLLDQWLRSLYAGQYGDLPETLVTTISGQKPLNPNLWSEYLPVIADIPLEPFTEAEARQFLASKDITDETTIQVILTLSGRLPLWIATLADARSQGSADIGDPTGNAVERFLKWEDDPARRGIAIAAALPRVLNQDVLAVITPADNVSELFGWLRSLPFVSPRGESWAYHDVVRAAMLRLRRAEAPSEWRSEQNSLAQANANWANQAAEGTNDTWVNPDWVDYTREETYHLLCADPHSNLPKALTSAVKAAEHSTIRARQWAALITDAGRDTNNDRLREWGQRLSDGIHDDDLAPYLTCLINDAQLDRTALIVALERRGVTYRLMKRYDDALVDLDRAIELDHERASASSSRGQAYRLMGRYDDALADFTRAIELDPSSDWNFADRGYTYQLMGRYDDALADLTRAIELDPSSDWAITIRGQTYRALERYDDALADFDRAIELDPSSDWAITIRGQTYQALERYDDALADFTSAIELDPSDADYLASRAETYRLIGRYDDALVDFDRAIELDPSSAWNFADRGYTYRALERYDDALADFDRAIELDPSSAWAITIRGQAYRALERYDDALADFDRAIELDPSSAWAITIRGQAYRALERYDDALADFDRAIELDPSSAWAITIRGQAYRALERYDDALADFDRAIELDPSSAWAITIRGQAYRALERYDDALADFDRAIELDPSSDWAIAGRGETYGLMGRYDDALADFTSAIELDPSDADYLASRAETYRLMGRYDDALADFTSAIELDPSDADYLASRAETYRLMGRYDDALADFTSAIELDPSDADYLASRAETYRLMGRYDDALADFTSAIELDPSSDWAIAGRGETYRALERYDDALADFTRAIELEPSDADYLASRAETYRLIGQNEEPPSPPSGLSRSGKAEVLSRKTPRLPGNVLLSRSCELLPAMEHANHAVNSNDV